MRRKSLEDFYSPPQVLLRSLCVIILSSFFILLGIGGLVIGFLQFLYKLIKRKFK